LICRLVISNSASFSKFRVLSTCFPLSASSNLFSISPWILLLYPLTIGCATADNGVQPEWAVCWGFARWQYHGVPCQVGEPLLRQVCVL
jgi:hypothetical protein